MELRVLKYFLVVAQEELKAKYPGINFHLITGDGASNL